MHLLIGTITLRPYVFVFLTSYLFIAIVNFGLLTTALFTTLTYGVALACEWSSVHNGFPFGLYHYIPATAGRELWVWGVPFMDSVSFTFLSFASYTVALLVTAPIVWQGWDPRLMDTRRLRRSPRVWLLAALFMVMVDMVVDPLSVLGDRWFLGRIFWYDPPGPHFGVPISNYVGWFFVAAVSVAILQWLDARLAGTNARPLGVWPRLRWRWLMGPALYAGIVVFALVMLFRIHARTIAWSGVFIYLPFLALVLNTLTRQGVRATPADVEQHLRDFPYDTMALPPAGTHPASCRQVRC